jgi:ABC-type sugar transport system permease subunit
VASASCAADLVKVTEVRTNTAPREVPLGRQVPAQRAPFVRRALRAVRTHRAAYLFILPSFIAFLVFTAYPTLDTVIVSFQNILGSHHYWVGLDNYRQMISDAVFGTAAKNTVLYFLYMVPLGLVLAVSLAALVSVLPSIRMQKLFKAAFYLPIATVSTVMLSLIWTYMYDPAFGVINDVLQTVGLPPQPWLSSPHTALVSLVIMMQTQWWGGMIILLVASIDAIPVDLYEASELDGASRIRQFRQITLPLIRPAMAYVTVIATISSFRIFNEIQLMTQGGPAYATENIAYYIYQTGINDFNFGEAAAFSTVLLAVTIIVAVVQYRLINRHVQY